MKVLKEHDITPTGQHFTVSWEVFQNILRGNGPILLGENEYIIAVKKVTDNGISICIGESNERQSA